MSCGGVVHPDVFPACQPLVGGGIVGWWPQQAAR